MAVAVDATSNGTAASTSSLTIAHTCAAGAVLYVLIYIPAGTTISSVTYNSVALTLVTTSNGNDSDGSFVAAFRLANPASGTNNIVITTSTSVAEIDGIGISVTGAAGTESGAAHTPNSQFFSGSPADYSHTVTSATGALAISAIGIGMGISSGVTVINGTNRGQQPTGNKTLTVATNPGAASVTFDYNASSGWNLCGLWFSINKTSVSFLPVPLKLTQAIKRASFY